MTTAEKVAYLKGLMEGMEYDVSTKEGKIIAGIVDILFAHALFLGEAPGAVERGSPESPVHIVEDPLPLVGLTGFQVDAMQTVETGITNIGVAKEHLQRHVFEEEHVEDILHRSTMHFSDGNLFPPLFTGEHYH